MKLLIGNINTYSKIIIQITFFARIYCVVLDHFG